MSSEESYYLGGERARLINDRLTELFQIRSKCERARSLQGKVPQEHHLAFHNAIRDVYLALRPLSHDDAIEEWWNSAIPSNRWGEWERGDVDDDDSFLIGKNEDGDAVFGNWKPYEGIDTLDRLRDISAGEQREVPVFGGTKISSERHPDPLPYDILLDISMTLEDAAERLGFMPEGAESTPRTDITQDMIMEVEKWRQQNV